MAKKEYEFTSGQLWALHNCIGAGSSQNAAGMAKRLSLLTMTDFTGDEQAAINYSVVVGAPGQQDQTTFHNDVPLTRRFTSGQRKAVIEMALEALPQLRGVWVAQWLWPALAVLKYTPPEADWDDEDNDEIDD